MVVLTMLTSTSSKIARSPSLPLMTLSLSSLVGHITTSGTFLSSSFTWKVHSASFFSFLNISEYQSSSWKSTREWQFFFIYLNWVVDLDGPWSDLCHRDPVQGPKMSSRDTSCGVYVIVCHKCNEFSCNITSKTLAFISLHGKFNSKKKSTLTITYYYFV